MLLLTTLAAALASPAFPLEIADLTAAVCVPTCTLCHQSELGGSGTVVQDFGLAMQARGLTGGSTPGELDLTLTAMVDDRVDSDGDGVIDVDEIAGGDNPNPGGAPFCDVLTPTYGCLSHAGGAPGAGLVWVALGLLAARRRPRSARVNPCCAAPPPRRTASRCCGSAD